MKFTVSNNFTYNQFGLMKKAIVALMIIFINFAEANKIVNFKNSLYLLDFKYYHTTENIDQELKKVVQECPDLIKEVTYDDFFNIPAKDRKENTKLLKFYDITDSSNTNKANNSTEKDNIYVLSGEHPRELIAVETTFNFMKFICKNKDKENIKNLLKKNIIRININANPYQRMKVEKGDFCVRGNPNNVDLNRNWDFHWGKEITTVEENAGKKPFSELETEFIKESVKKFKPKLFLSIHSGDYSLVHPYSYFEEDNVDKLDLKNKDKMLGILNQLKKELCPQCAVGNTFQTLGYKASGSCMDYVYENFKTPYSFVWEIYTNEKEFKEMNDYVKSKNKPTNENKNQNNLKKPSITNATDKVAPINKSFLESSNQVYLKAQNHKRLFKSRNLSEKENKECFQIFNPPNKDSYDYIVENWRKALIKIVEMVNAN